MAHDPEEAAQMKALRFLDTEDNMLEDLQAKIQEMAARYTSSTDLHNWIMHFKEFYAEVPEKSDKIRPRTTIENDEDNRTDERTAHPEGVKRPSTKLTARKPAAYATKMVEDLLATLAAKENELAKAKREIDSLNQTVVNVVRDSSRRSATSNLTSITSARGKSSKISDPPIFYADKSKDTVTFEV
ncbi:hypothetical protein QBC32DRAFT_386534 [Pseudoneurospora amorphoporcata]|uniref:Uncharacterized protein n=1 Tax=Pseudoneurospora amorphoporcata TaxID=241081 RepID=A0AAN6NNP8_9PEZI|nr:hypothetical protein QBC32DRAFT_386534 [Pseudoneurospora amorphoporcata]